MPPEQPINFQLYHNLEKNRNKPGLYITNSSYTNHHLGNSQTKRLSPHYIIFHCDKQNPGDNVTVLSLYNMETLADESLIKWNPCEQKS